MEWSSQTQTNAGILYNPMYEYLLVAHPDENVYLRVAEEKQSFFDIYKEKIAVKTKPHITVACFLAKEVMEETIIVAFLHILFISEYRIISHLNNWPPPLK